MASSRVVDDIAACVEDVVVSRHGRQPKTSAQGALPLGDGAPAARSPAPRAGERSTPLSVGSLVRAAGRALDATIGVLWVQGEVASLSRASSGHLYFALKDERAHVRAVIWRSDAAKLRFRIDNGQAIRCRGRLGIYERDGKFQLYVGYAEPVGVGADALALEQLRAALEAEGLFATERKRVLPALPRRIGVVTSRSGAALRDIVRVIHRRFPVPILVAHARVQGIGAPGEIVSALRALARRSVDVIIIGRGGGSKLDLAAFNHEAVVRAVAACPVPTVSAVGHEVDVTLSDLAADRRAATPSQAGEMVVPVLADLSAMLSKEERRLDRELTMRLRTARQDIDRLASAFEHATRRSLGEHHRTLAGLQHRLATRHPRAQLEANRNQLQRLDAALAAAILRRADASARSLGTLASRLQSLSPLHVLDRGYALARAGDRVLTDAAQVAPGDEVAVRLARGTIDCRVERVHDAGGEGAPSTEGDE